MDASDATPDGTDGAPPSAAPDESEATPEVTPNPPSRAWATLLAILRRLPQASLSRGLGRLADLPLPRLVRVPALRAFASAFDIDVDEAARPLSAYGSLNDFFVRRLREGVREWPEGPAVASPVDGVVGQVGRVDAGRLLQAKGRSYAAADLLESEEEAERYDGGHFVTLYLSPRHYHRVHAPRSGRIHAARYVPGSLLPVNAPSVQSVEDLFARNERLLCTLEHDEGALAVVAVGAYNVGRISAAFDPAWSGLDGHDGPDGPDGLDGRDSSRGPDGPAWVTNRKQRPPTERRYDPPIEIERGDELMAFHLGSTVILLLERDRYELDRACRPGQEVRLGEVLARPVA